VDAEHVERVVVLELLSEYRHEGETQNAHDEADGERTRHVDVARARRDGDQARHDAVQAPTTLGFFKTIHSSTTQVSPATAAAT